MKIAYAFRRTAFYPYDGGTGWEVPPPEVRGAYLRAVRELGFEGIEIGLGQGVGETEAEVRELRRELEDAGLACAAVRGGGGYTDPQVAAKNRQRLHDAIRMAAWIGAGLVNMTVTTPTGNPPGLIGGGVGRRVSPGGSRTASEADYTLTAGHLREAADLAADLGVDILFAPAVEEMYPLGFGTTVDPGPVAVGLDGAARPGHFEGVATVVTRLFGIVAPDVSYFGLKDFQQVAVIRRLVADLALPVEIRALPIVRESDGLACSSRNRMLTAEARERAPSLQRGLAAAEALYQDGERAPDVLLEAAADVIEPSGLAVEYLELRDAETLGPYTAERAAVLAAAVHVAGVRLIDNVTLAPPRAVVRLDASAELIRKASR